MQFLVMQFFVQDLKINTESQIMHLTHLWIEIHFFKSRNSELGIKQLHEISEMQNLSRKQLVISAMQVLILKSEPSHLLIKI
jgi:hypothetical protein